MIKLLTDKDLVVVRDYLLVLFALDIIDMDTYIIVLMSLEEDREYECEEDTWPYFWEVWG